MRSVCFQANCTTSTGRGKPPRQSTIFVSSQMQIVCLEAWAIIFSHSRQAPPPLIILNLRSISSGPSTVRSSSPMSLGSVISMPTSRATSIVERDVVVQVSFIPAATCLPSSRTKKCDVVPDPRPSFMPSRTNSWITRRPATFLASSCALILPPLAQGSAAPLQGFKSCLSANCRAPAAGRETGCRSKWQWRSPACW